MLKMLNNALSDLIDRKKERELKKNIFFSANFPKNALMLHFLNAARIYMKTQAHANADTDTDTTDHSTHANL